MLACTHFPLLKVELQSVIDAPIIWVDSGKAIARRVGYWLDQLTLNHRLGVNGTEPSKPRPQHQSLFTQASTEIESLRPYLAQQLGDQLRILEI